LTTAPPDRSSTLADPVRGVGRAVIVGGAQPAATLVLSLCEHGVGFSLLGAGLCFAIRLAAIRYSLTLPVIQRGRGTP
jgi:hypothetical protein